MNDALEDAVRRFILKDAPEDRCPRCSSENIDVKRVGNEYGGAYVAWAWCHACNLTLETGHGIREQPPFRVR